MTGVEEKSAVVSGDVEGGVAKPVSLGYLVP